MRQRLGRIQTRGSRKAQSFSENVLDRIKSLSYQYTELDQSVTDTLSSLEKSLASIKEDMSKTRKEITELTTSKLGQKDFEAAEKERSAELAKTFAAFRKDVNEQKASLENSIAEVNSELGEARHTLSNLGKDLEAEKNELAEIFHVMETIGKEAQEQEAIISSLSEQKLDREAIDALLEDERQRYQEETALLEKKLRALEEEIVWLEKQVNISGPRHREATAESPHPSEESVGKPSRQDATSPSEKIIEQEITQ
jgi:chromosome segregation ATPase